MTASTREWPRSVVMLAFAIAVPLVLASLLIMLEHWGAIPSSAFDRLPWQLIVVTLILPGLIPIAFLRWPLEWKIAAGLLYFVAMFAIMPLYALVFGCTFTGDCI